MTPQIITVDLLKEAFPKEGKFYIGDPCYVFKSRNYETAINRFWNIPMTDEEYEKIDKSKILKEIELGYFPKDESRLRGIVELVADSSPKRRAYLMEVKNEKFIMASTNYGDGGWPIFEFDDIGHCLESHFSVDSGLFCIVPYNSTLLKKDKKDYIQYDLDFSKLSFIDSLDRGHLVLKFEEPKEIIIDTRR